MPNSYYMPPSLPYNSYDPYGRPQPIYPYRYDSNNVDYLLNQQNGAMGVPPNMTQSTNPQQNMTCIRVTDRESAQKVFVAPNQILYMVAQNRPELYVKATDSMGLGQIRYFKIFEFNPEEEQAQTPVSDQMQNVVTQEEFNNFASAVKATLASIQQNMLSRSELQELQRAESHTPMPVKPQVKKQTKNEQLESNSVIGLEVQNK